MIAMMQSMPAFSSRSH